MDFFEQKFQAEVLQQGMLFLIDKPLGWTSFQVVNKIRWHLKNQTGLKKLKVGHAGTLDPLATGLLLICTGKKTKTIHELQQKEKTYSGIICLGATTPSYDLETNIDAQFPIKHISDELVHDTAKSLTGEIQQYPPLFSALKKEGKRLYEYARAGEKTTLEKRTVIINKFDITHIKLPEVHFLVECSKGTYIRSLTHDFGKKLKSGAHLTSLKRIKNGNFSLVDAYTMNSVVDENNKKSIRSVKSIK